MVRAGKRRAWPWLLLFIGIALAGVFYVGGGWYFSSLVYDDALKAEPYDPASLQGGTVQAAEISESEGSVTLLPDEEHRDETRFIDAVVGLVIGESLVVAGPAEQQFDGSQVRDVLDVVGDVPEPGARYGLTRDVWLTPEQAGMESQDITIETLEGGQFPAWLIPGTREKRWAVLTHGKGAARSEMLRMARPLNEAGFNVLLITYTGDVGAPPYEDGMVTYGRLEWRELEAAVEYALDRGATRLVLGGASHGGAVTLGFMARSPVAVNVDGLVLDAPASSLRDILDEAAEFRSLPVGGLPIPESLEDVATWFVRLRFGVDFSAIDYISPTDLIPVPLLTFQGAIDETVPEPVSDRLMNEGSGSGGEYVVVPGAEHVLSWNLDPEGYDERVKEFVRGL
jgi:pimeloyl-ACP methyl ester carboxylesterase